MKRQKYGSTIYMCGYCIMSCRDDPTAAFTTMLLDTGVAFVLAMTAVF